MKKILATALALYVVFATRAQEIPERKQDGYKPHGEKGMHHHRPGGMDFKQLNLTDAQKEQMKTQRESFHKQMEELKKNDNITVKEWRTRMENLRKEQKSGMEKILTADQKKQLEKMKADQHSKMEERRKQGAEKMKQHLGLTDEQSAKLAQSRKVTGDQIKAIRENKSLSDEKKREEMKEVMKKQKETMKSVLTEEQLQKMKEHKHHGPHKDGKKPGMPKETI